MPGHAIRRLQQRAVAKFMAAAKPWGLTPVQYAAMHQLAISSNLDQRSLAYAIDIDTSTVADVLDRLEARGWIERHASAYDRRVRLVQLTIAGLEVLEQAAPVIAAVQPVLLNGLTPTEQQAFQELVQKLIR
jgi:DNA-binding MarR family transcriptional regulator